MVVLGLMLGVVWGVDLDLGEGIGGLLRLLFLLDSFGAPVG